MPLTSRGSTAGSNAVHCCKYLFSLHFHPHRQLLALAVEPLAERMERDRRIRQIDHHDHGEESADHRLADIEDVDVGLGQHIGNAGNDADAVG